MSSLHITLFGRIHYTADGQEVGGMEARKAQELDVYKRQRHPHRGCARKTRQPILPNGRD